PAERAEHGAVRSGRQLLLVAVARERQPGACPHRLMIHEGEAEPERRLEEGVEEGGGGQKRAERDLDVAERHIVDGLLAAGGLLAGGLGSCLAGRLSAGRLSAG